MSLLPPEVHSALSQLLRALTTPDNTVRTQAEEQLNNDWIQNRPDVLLMGLAEQIQGAEDTVVSDTSFSGDLEDRACRHRDRFKLFATADLNPVIASY
jgi:hypothetical protein